MGAYCDLDDACDSERGENNNWAQFGSYLDLKTCDVDADMKSITPVGAKAWRGK